LNAPDQRRIARQLLDLSLPIIGLNVLNVIALAVDTAMCGRLQDSERVLTALGFSTQVVFLLMVLMIGLTVGSVAFVARAHGAGHDERVNHVLHQSTQLTLLLGMFIAIAGNLLAPWILAGLGADPDVNQTAQLYLRPLLAGTPFYYVSLLYAAVLRGVGNTRLAFVVALASNGLNVVLNYGLILGNWGLPALGIQGAAIGTVCAHAFGSVLLFVLLRRGAVGSVRPTLRPKRFDRPLVGDLVRIGWPAAADMVVLNAAFLSIIGMLGHVEQVAVAAHGIGLRIQALAFVPGMSISQATGAMIGQALGARDLERAKAVLWSSAVLCTAVMTTLGLGLIALAAPIVRIFDVDPASRLGELSIVWMECLGYGLPIVGFYIAFVGLLQGSGATKTSLRINLLTTLVFQIPASYVLGFTLGLGPFGIWVAFPLGFVLKAGLGLREYRRGEWAKLGARA